jgi:hypothetical protein
VKAVSIKKVEGYKKFDAFNGRSKWRRSPQMIRNKISSCLEGSNTYSRDEPQSLEKILEGFTNGKGLVRGEGGPTRKIILSYFIY